MSANLPQYSVAIISDVSVGYGTPQILSMARSFAHLLGSQIVILEPDQPERPRIELDLESNIEVRRLYTATHPYSPSGQVEYNLCATAELDALKPDIVVLCAFLGGGALFKMKHKPRVVIYYGLEHTDGHRHHERRLLQMCAEKIDFAIFPEENRALLDAPRLGLERKPYVIVYNGSSTEVETVGAQARNQKFFYGGLLHPNLTFSDYFFDGSLDNLRIDLFGLIDGYAAPTEKVASLAQRRSRVSYNGYLPSGSGYMNILKYYNFSLVFWNPDRESTLYAAPNKFFDAIQAGVPLITAPHPLCKNLVQRYNCGVVMGGFSFADLKLALRDAEILRKSNAYAEMVEKNLPVARGDLSWDAQFRKVETILRKQIAV